MKKHRRQHRKLRVMKARDYGLYLLGKRSYGIKEMEQKLKGKKFSDEEISETIEEFKEKGWLDDYEFGLILSRNQFLKKKSRKQVENSLYSKGIAGDIIKEVLSLTYDAEREREVLHGMVAKYRRSGDLSKETIMRRLLYRGFSLDEIKRALEDY